MAMNLIKSVYDNQPECIKAIMDLHTHGIMEADFTYDRGGLWKKLKQPQLKFDLEPRADKIKPTLKFDYVPRSTGVIAADVRNLPIPDGCIRSAIFDPPFVHQGKDHAKDSIIQKNQYGCFESYIAMLDFMAAAAEDVFRVLTGGGIVAVKCQDYVHDSANIWAHIDVYRLFIELGYQARDLFILLAKARPIRPMKKQRHARKFHCYFWIFRKPGRRPKYSRVPEKC